jgi:hypothetical protein
MQRLDDTSYVAREYATLDRLQMRRLDRTGWVRFDDWTAVGAEWARDVFDADSGLPYLERRFARVERLIRRGAVLWLAREDLQAYLDASGEMVGVLRAPDGPYPFVASRAKCVFVAEAA